MKPYVAKPILLVWKMSEHHESSVSEGPHQEQQVDGSTGKPGMFYCVSGPSSLFAEPPVGNGMAWTLRILNVAGFFLVAISNGLVSRLGGEGIGDVSDRNPTPFTPAGYAFSIWGLIYLFQAVMFLVYQFLPFANKGLLFRRIAWWHVALCVFNISWIVLFSYAQLLASCLVIWCMLGCLAIMYVRIHVADFGSFLCTAAVRRTRSWAEYICVYVPWALYTSWLLGASLLNVFIARGKDPAEAVAGGVVAVAVAGIVNVMVLLWARDVVFAGVNVWTLIAIANNNPLPEIWGTSVAMACVVGACAVVTWVSNVAEMWTSRSASSPPHGLPPECHDNDTAMIDAHHAANGGEKQTNHHSTVV